MYFSVIWRGEDWNQVFKVHDMQHTQGNEYWIDNWSRKHQGMRLLARMCHKLRYNFKIYFSRKKHEGMDWIQLVHSKNHDGVLGSTKQYNFLTRQVSIIYLRFKTPPLKWVCYSYTQFPSQKTTLCPQSTNPYSQLPSISGRFCLVHPQPEEVLSSGNKGHT